MPNYVLSRTSPPAHIYERKVNLGYGVKVDTSDVPNPKERTMEDAKQTLDVAEKPVTATFADGSVHEGTEINAFASASALDEAEATKEAQRKIDEVGY